MNSSVNALTLKKVNQSIGMMVEPLKSVSINRNNLKDNSGTLEDWSEFSYQVVELPEAIEKLYYDRDGMMTMLKNALHSEMHRTGGPLVMRAPNQGSAAFYATVDSPARLEESGMGPNVVLVKMWGFAGMREAEEMLSHYSNGVDALFKMPAFVGALKNNAQVVLHFDGDAAYEKKDKKFSHNLFAPFVANMITARTGGNVPVHLVVTKVDELDPRKNETLLTMVGKFCDTNDGFTSCNFRTEESPVAHSYPYFDRRFFDSGALYVSERGPIKSTGSEGQNSQMMEQLFKGRILGRFCLGIGGNTKAKDFKTGIPGGGVVSMKQFIDLGLAFPFNGAVRVNVDATK